MSDQDKKPSPNPLPPLELEYRDWKPEYLYSLGELSPFFRAIKEGGRLMTSRCPKCAKRWMWPHGECPDCYEDVEWVPISGEGKVIACSYVYFKGHGVELLGYLDLPYVYALIHLDGTDTYISHGIKPRSQKMGEVKTGDRVKAVFKPQAERRGTIGDFYFVPVD